MQALGEYCLLNYVDFMIVLQRIYTSYKKLAEDAEVEVSRRTSNQFSSTKKSSAKNPHLSGRFGLLPIYSTTQIAYIGVISPAHKELVHLMLDAGKVWI